ncbi:hypothetical protein EYF80_043136 [Liparis tanakae]|uniref:Uncharacterized protein n=1 Tax=Liparis tanakae TaxID=230148 RepID=A0A4Z2FZK8_9TELE|nr:hypothetical protein EYF80_043136 [Liparis tanakae]
MESLETSTIHQEMEAERRRGRSLNSGRSLNRAVAQLIEEKTQVSPPSGCSEEFRPGLSLYGSHGGFKYRPLLARSPTVS